ncbi:MAG: hypothetical protein E6L08_10525 [Verrucomicrobia bacterium]|nr:MAG: hypothetical protein E6L08_10525 [Verrucomicrobiota bacterium]
MADVGVEVRSEICSVDIGRGLRCVLNSSGQLALAGLTVRGDYMTLTDGKAGEPVAVASMDSGKVSAVPSETVAVGDLAYSVAGGQTSKTATSAVLVGRWTQPSTVGVLSEVELFAVA